MKILGRLTRPIRRFRNGRGMRKTRMFDLVKLAILWGNHWGIIVNNAVMVELVFVPYFPCVLHACGACREGSICYSNDQLTLHLPPCRMP